MAGYLILYPTCQVVKGAVRSTISDLEKNNFHYIPNDLADVIEYLRNVDYNVFIQGLDVEDQETIEEYKDFLLKHNLAFFTEKVELFPPIDLQFYPSAKISDAILDRNESSTYDIFQSINELNRYNCRHLQIRFFATCDLKYLDSILEHIQKTDILSVDIFYKFNRDELPMLKKFINKWTKIKLFLVHSAPYSKLFILNKKNIYTSNMGNFIYTDEIIPSEQSCGCIAYSYFTVNISCFSESINFNSCLNHKLSIDVHGKIKNCPTLKEEYGSFGITPLSEVLENEKYKSYGNIKKDQISICRDCEHRHFCTDCRAFVDNILDKPKKCTYDPYTLKWN